MRILYLTWGEVPRMSSVYGGQVVRVVEALQNHPHVESAKLLAGYPMIHSGLVREKHRYGEQLAAIRKRIGADNLIRRHLPVPPVGIYPKPWQMPSFFVGQHGFVARVIKRERPDIVHCRSYLASRIALQVRERYDFTYKVIFDARSLLPEEAAVLGRWAYDSSAYKMWKALEGELLQNSDLSLAVSLPMQRRLDDLGAKRSGLIYLNVDTDALDDVKMKDTSRIDTGNPVLVYAGYLASGSWHNPLNLWKVFASFQSHCPGAKLTVITKSSHNALKAHLAETGFAELAPRISFTSARSPSETVQKLQDCDIAIFSYRDPENEAEMALAEPVFATKTAEYLSAGLPVIVNETCGGAREYIRQKNAGIAYNIRTLLAAGDVEKILQQARQRPSISDAARSDFSLTQNAGRLVHHYETLLGLSGAHAQHLKQ